MENFKGAKGNMGLVKILTDSESIYKIQPNPVLDRPVSIAIDSSRNEFLVEKIIDDKVMMVTHHQGIRCKVWRKGFRIVKREEGSIPKPIKRPF